MKNLLKTSSIGWRSLRGTAVAEYCKLDDDEDEFTLAFVFDDANDNDVAGDSLEKGVAAMDAGLAIRITSSNTEYMRVLDID